MIYQCPQCHASYEVDEKAVPRFCSNCGAPVVIPQPQVPPDSPKVKLVSPVTPQPVPAASPASTDDLQEYPVEKAFFFGLITLGILPALKWSKTTTAILNTFREEDIRYAKQSKAICAWWGYIYILLEVISGAADISGCRILQLSVLAEAWLVYGLGQAIYSLPWEKVLQDKIRRTSFWSIGMKLVGSLVFAFIMEVMPSLLAFLIAGIIATIWVPVLQNGVNMAVRAARARLAQQQ